MSWINALSRRPFLAVMALALLLGLAFQGSRGLWEPDEGRYSNVALQILDSGDWISLARNRDSLHFTKPPLHYWTVAASVAAFGWNEWAVRLPAALAFALSVGLVFGLGRTFVPRRPWLPALIYATCPLPFLASNTITTDTLLAAMETLAMLCFVRARLDGASPRWLDAMWLAFGLAFLTKGPPALLPLIAVVAFQFSQRGGASLLRPIGLLAFAVVGLSWFVVVIERHPGLLDYFLGHEVYARIATDKLKRFPQWYGPLLVYLPSFLLGALPWVAAALWRARAARPRWGTATPELRLLWLWFGLPLIVFCLSRSRLPLYVLPLFAPLALLMARALQDIEWTTRHRAAIAAWIVVLLLVKAALPYFPHEKDSREFAADLKPLLPGPPSEIVFVEDMARYGLRLYLHAQIQKASFKPWPHPISDAEFDKSLAQALAEPGRGRVYILKRENDRYFLDAVHAAGLTPVPLGVLADGKGRDERDRMVYTLPGQFDAGAR